MKYKIAPRQTGDLLRVTPPLAQNISWRSAAAPLLTPLGTRVNRKWMDSKQY